MDRVLFALRADGAVGTVAADLDGFITSVTGGLADFTTANLGKILVAGLGIAAGLALAWFGYRWIVRKLSGALKKGRIG